MSRTGLVAAIIAALNLIMVLLNNTPVETSLLFVTIAMPRAFPLAGILPWECLPGCPAGRSGPA